MKGKRFTEEQIALAMRQLESGTAVADIVRKMGVSEQTFYRRKKKFPGLGVAKICFHNAAWQSTPGGDVHRQAVAALAAIERQKASAHGGGQ